MSNAIKVGDTVTRKDVPRAPNGTEATWTVLKLGKRTATLDGGTVVLRADLELAPVRFPTCVEQDGVLFYATGKVGHRADSGIEVHELAAAGGARVWASADGRVFAE